jgi:hypothetical protein
MEIALPGALSIRPPGRCAHVLGPRRRKIPEEQAPSAGGIIAGELGFEPRLASFKGWRAAITLFPIVTRYVFGLGSPCGT